jgi:hypothetical protein
MQIIAMDDLKKEDYDLKVESNNGNDKNFSSILPLHGRAPPSVIRKNKEKIKRKEEIKKNLKDGRNDDKPIF